MEQGHNQALCKLQRPMPSRTELCAQLKSDPSVPRTLRCIPLLCLGGRTWAHLAHAPQLTPQCWSKGCAHGADPCLDLSCCSAGTFLPFQFTHLLSTLPDDFQFTGKGLEVHGFLTTLAAAALPLPNGFRPTACDQSNAIVVGPSVPLSL